jgi:hypothetical protein
MLETTLANIHGQSIDLICGTAGCDQNHKCIDPLVTLASHGIISSSNMGTCAQNGVHENLKKVQKATSSCVSGRAYGTTLSGTISIKHLTSMGVS